jgi:hypothetical protein
VNVELVVATLEEAIALHERAKLGDRADDQHECADEREHVICDLVERAV